MCYKILLERERKVRQTDRLSVRDIFRESKKDTGRESKIIGICAFEQNAKFLCVKEGQMKTERDTRRETERDRERQRETERDRERQRETERDREILRYLNLLLVFLSD